MSKIIVEDLTEPKVSEIDIIRKLADSIYVTAIYSGLHMKLRSEEILKALLIAAKGASSYMVKIGLITEEELEHISNEVDEIVNKQNTELESSGVLDTIKQVAKEYKKNG